MKRVRLFSQSYTTKGRSLLPSAIGPSTLQASTISHSSVLASSPSSSREPSDALIIFKDWGDGRIFDWYHDYRKGRSTLIRKLQLRKERDNFKHEFTVIFMDNGLIHRIDRRPRGGASVSVVWESGCDAEDTIILVAKDAFNAIEIQTNLEIEVEFGSKKPDLYSIIAICVSIRMDPESGRYTLQHYNCYFLARTITILTIRHYILEQSSTLSDNLRWDALTERSISTHIFKEDWTPLNEAMKNALIAILEKDLLPVVKQDAEMLVDKRKHWLELEKKAKVIIQDTVMGRTGDLVEELVKDSVIRWVIEVTQASLWRDNIEERLSDLPFKDFYGDAAQSALTGSAKPNLTAVLPDMIGEIVPKRLLNRIPPSLLLSLPPDTLARLPAHFLAKLPDEIILNTPPGFLIRAPSEYFRKLPISTFQRSPNAVVLSLPDDLGRLPDNILDAALERMQMLLDEPPDTDRILALKLLKRLPGHILRRVPPQYWAMRDEKLVEEIEVSQPVATVEVAPPVLQNARPKKDPFAIILLMIPRRVLDFVPGIIAEIFPKSWYQGVSNEVLEALPPRFISKLRPSFLTSMPVEVLERIPESLIKSIKQETLERLPDDFLEKLPVQLLRNLPDELLANLPEKVTDLLRREIDENIFTSAALRVELIDRAASILKTSLLHAPGVFLEPAIRVSARSNSRMKANQLEILSTHEDLQREILAMNRRHSKMVAKISHMGIGEGVVYDNLRRKTEVVWEEMRPHAMPL